LLSVLLIAKNFACKEINRELNEDHNKTYLEEEIILKGILALLLIMISAHTFAQGSSGYISLTNKKIQIISGGSPRVYVYDAPIANSGCSGSTSIPVLLMDDTVAIHKEMYAMLLAAKASGKEVAIVTDGCWNNGEYPKIHSIYMNE
jgi:hypothetical protein